MTNSFKKKKNSVITCRTVDVRCKKAVYILRITKIIFTRKKIAQTTRKKYTIQAKEGV